MIYLALACRALLLGVFATSCASKLRGRDSFGAFADSLAAMRVPRRPWSRPAAAAIVAAEAIAALLLAVPGLQVAGFILGLALLAAFTCVIVLAIRVGLNVGCRCFGASAAPFGPLHVVRNVLLAGTCMVGVLTTTASVSAHVDPAGAVVALVAAAVLLLFAVRADDVVAALETDL
jgi:hypothetical protein